MKNIGFNTYKDLISPYLVKVNPDTGVQTGFIKTTSTIASVRPDVLKEVITQLTAAKKSMDVMFHKDFIQKLDAIRNNSKFDAETREQLNWIHQMYDNNSVNSARVIEMMREKGMYDVVKDELSIDPLKKNLKQDMQEIYDVMKFDIANGAEVANLESQINQMGKSLNLPKKLLVKSF